MGNNKKLKRVWEERLELRMLVKNNAKKRKLLSTPAIVNGWNEWSLEEPEDEEEQEAWEELETCWKSSDESADEADQSMF